MPYINMRGSCISLASWLAPWPFFFLDCSIVIFALPTNAQTKHQLHPHWCRHTTFTSVQVYLPQLTTFPILRWNYYVCCCRGFVMECLVCGQRHLLWISINTCPGYPHTVSVCLSACLHLVCAVRILVVGWSKIVLLCVVSPSITSCGACLTLPDLTLWAWGMVKACLLYTSDAADE